MADFSYRGPTGTRGWTVGSILTPRARTGPRSNSEGSGGLDGKGNYGQDRLNGATIGAGFRAPGLVQSWMERARQAAGITPAQSAAAALEKSQQNPGAAITQTGTATGVDNPQLKPQNAVVMGATPQVASPLPVAPAVPKSVVGPVNALGQQSAMAMDLMTPGGYARDRKLASRAYMNPNTGNRQVAISGSVYRGQTPAYLAQSLDRLNMEQGLRRSLQSEWNNRLLQMAHTPSPDQYLWQEAVRAASVQPGTAVTFSQAVQNPAIGEGYKKMATEQAEVEKVRSQALQQMSWLQRELDTLGASSSPRRAELMSQIDALKQRAALAAPAGGTGTKKPATPAKPPTQSGWTGSFSPNSNLPSWMPGFVNVNG